MCCSSAISPGMPNSAVSRCNVESRRFNPPAAAELTARPAGARETARAHALHLVKELDAFIVRLHAIDAHRAAQVRGFIGAGRAREMEELSGNGSQRGGGGAQHQMLVFGVDPVVRAHRADIL